MSRGPSFYIADGHTIELTVYSKTDNKQVALDITRSAIGVEPITERIKLKPEKQGATIITYASTRFPSSITLEGHTDRWISHPIDELTEDVYRHVGWEDDSGSPDYKDLVVYVRLKRN